MLFIIDTVEDSTLHTNCPGLSGDKPHQVDMIVLLRRWS